MTPRTIGQLMLGFRLRAGITQRDLARAASVSVRTVRDIEQDRVARPRAPSVRRLAAALGLRDADRGRLLALLGGRTDGPALVSVGVLGPLAVVRDGEPVTVGAPKLRCLLALLAIQPGLVVTRDQLVDALWPAGPPKTSADLIQGYLASLRAVLDPDRPRDEAGRLVRSGAGYILRLAGDELDLLRFDDLVARAGSGGGPEAAFDRLGEALDVWRGPVLADLDAGLRQLPPAVAIAGRRLAATLRFADLATALGRHEAAVSRLRAVVGDEPWHEGLHARLMLALARSGQQAAALAQFADLRARLVDEFGVEPGPEIAAAHLRVLRQDLGDPHRSASGGRAGDSRAGDSRAGGEDTSRAEPAAVRPAQLPADVAAFTGRAAQLRHLDTLVRDRPPARATAMVISAIAGTAGVGKTSLAVHWAHRVRGHFPDGQLYINLHGHDSGSRPPLRPVDALARVLPALGVPAEQIPVDVEAAAGVYRSLLADRRMLVLLDNARDADQVRPLLPGSPGCLVLVTSRDRMTGLVAHEGIDRLTLDVLTPEEAAALMVRLLGRRRVHAEPAAAVALAEACARLPLALRVAMANLLNHPRVGIAEYLTRLQGDNRLAAFESDGDYRAAVRAAFEVSYRTLPPAARRLFRLLSLVPGPEVSPAAAAALLPAPSGDAEALLDRLAAAHLLAEHTPGRFAFHDLLRSYAGERARAEDGAEELARAADRLFGFYLRAVDAAARRLNPEKLRLPVPAGPSAISFDDHRDALAWLDGERPNLVAAVIQAAARGPRPAAWLLGDALRGYFQIRLHAVDWLTVADAGATAALAEGDARARAAAEINLADANLLRSTYETAIGHYHHALAYSREGGWVQAEAAVLGNLGNAYLRSGQLVKALDAHRRALAINRRSGWVAGQAANLGNLGIEHAELGHLAVAADHNLRALDLYRKIGSRSGEAHTLANLGETHHWLGRLDDALGWLTRALALHRELGDEGNAGDTLRALAEVHRDAGRLDLALDLARTALDAVRDTGYRRPEVDACNALGATHLDLGDVDRAADFHHRARDLARETGNRFSEARALIGLAAVHRRRAAPEATAVAEEAVALTRSAGFLVLEGRALTALAAVDLDAGRPEAARRHADRAREIQVATGDRLGLADSYAVLGGAAAAPDRARAHLRRARDLYAEVGAPGRHIVRIPDSTGRVDR
ncbi:BTAD domain-containing putative transcriptional regulator [Virgisporangium aurantiacum]|uniref:SARP family transcriptional regulator n=1 Tax=Virgisporangium aurantiacum TaxID=175570 RepID=A0A8J4E594_9ACTN|nr:BTAD domain-containing putative transcriptional regulator [Virgisporangium aurantiacum]GIJ62800.1 SARP family transcriptional regulator [Virgisporangium aurantiacum]